MKELETIQQDKMEVQTTVPVKKELKLLGTLKPHPGHTCFQLDTKTGEITVAEFEKIDAVYNPAFDGAAVRKKLLVKDGCLYVTALNMKNAKKRFEKMIEYVVLNHKP